MDKVVSRAREFAVAAHGDQRYGQLPYVVHLDAVANLLLPFGEQAQVVGYLHDIVEDTQTGIDAIREQFGARVAECVSLVTDCPGVNRRERKRLTNAKLAASEDELALIVKAADRLANLRASMVDSASSKLEMYRREHPEFRDAVYRPRLCDEFWVEMAEILNNR